MAKKTATFATVRRLGLPLPGVEEGTTYGTPALKVRGKMFACIANHKSAEAGTLVVCIPFDQRDALVAEEPDVYYLKDHYVGYACVLVRLKRIPEDALRDLLLSGWRFVSSGGRVQKRKEPSAEGLPARNRRHPLKKR
jgi:hypothetical protein